MTEIRPRLKGNKKIAYQHITKKESRILVIGDLHEPFCLDSYLDHCQYIYSKHNCNKVIFIGDLIDNHFSSYHETDPDGMSGAEELEFAIKRIARWYEAFPKADVLIGNHDRLIRRKAFSGNIPKAWIKSYKEVLKTPKWKFKDRVVYDNVQYVHGEAGTARTKCKSDLMSTVQGHLHTQAYTEYSLSLICIDFDQYSFAYAKRGKKPAIGCAVVFGGKTCINELMELGK